MIRMFLLFILALLSAPAWGEMPCVTPADAVLVIDSPAAQRVLEGSGITRFRCPPGKRVGLWISSPEPARLTPMMIMDCEVGIVVETRYQTVKEFSIIGARVGVCWQASDGVIQETLIEATEVGVSRTSLTLRLHRNFFYVSGRAYTDNAGGCTCPGAV